MACSNTMLFTTKVLVSMVTCARYSMTARNDCGCCLTTEFAYSTRMNNCSRLSTRKATIRKSVRVHRGKSISVPSATDFSCMTSRNTNSSVCHQWILISSYPTSEATIKVIFTSVPTAMDYRYMTNRQDRPHLAASRQATTTWRCRT